jgi:hypothetical protein
MSKTRKIKLKLQPDTDFSIIGIACHDNDFRLSWGINQIMGISLSKTDDLELVDIKKPDQKQLFSMYAFYDENSMINFQLIANRCDEGLLIKEYPNLDFILKLSKEASQNEVNEIKAKIKSLDMVMMTAIIPTDSIKKVERLVF